MSGVHGKQVVSDGIHIPYAWEFADATARAATTDPNTGASYVAADIGKFARQVDDNSIWMLTGTTPDWIGISVNSPVDGLTAGRVVFVGADGRLADDSLLVWDNINKRLGIGLTDPGGKVEIKYQTKDLSVNASGTNQVHLSLMADDSLAADIGGAIGFGGKYITASEARILFAAITGRRENATSGVAHGYLAFWTWLTTGMVERMRINSTGQVSIAGTNPVIGSKLDVAGDIVVSDGAGGAKIILKDTGIINYNGTMGDSTKNPTVDAPSDWVEVQIAGTTYYLPAYTA